LFTWIASICQGFSKLVIYRVKFGNISCVCAYSDTTGQAGSPEAADGE